MANTTKARAMDHRNPQRHTHATNNATKTNNNNRKGQQLINPSAPSAPKNALSAGASLPAPFAVPTQIETPPPPQHKTACHNIGDEQPKLQRKLLRLNIELLATITERSRTLAGSTLAERMPQFWHTRTGTNRATLAPADRQTITRTTTHAHPPTHRGYAEPARPIDTYRCVSWCVVLCFATALAARRLVAFVLRRLELVGFLLC